MKTGQKFIDEHGRELTLVEINELGEYVVSYYSEEHSQHVISVYEKEELEALTKQK